MEGNQESKNPTSEELTGQTLKVDDIIEVEVTAITDFGAFVKLFNGKKGLIHISQISDSYVKEVKDHLMVGDKVKARVISVSPDGKIALTLKSNKPPVARPREPRRPSDNNRQKHSSSFPKEKPFNSSFEEKLRKDFEEKRGGRARQ